MKSVAHNQLTEKLEKYYNTRTPLFLWGAMGIGKSMIIKDFANSKGLNLIDVRVSQLEPSDLRGLPKIDNGVTKWLPPSWLPKEGNGILFFDELNLAPPSIQASAYQLILDRKLGEYELPKGWVIISAGNRLEDKANVFELPAPLSNRFTHLELMIPTIESWTDWAIKNNIDNRIISFLQWKRDRLFLFDAKNKDRAFATPRTWEKANSLICDVDNREDVEIFLSSAVGEGTTMEFIGFLKLTDKINIEELIKNPQIVTKITELSEKYSVVSVATDYFKAHKNKEVFENVITIAKYLEAEFGILLLRLIKGADEKFFMTNVMNSKVFVNELKQKFVDYIN